MTHHLSSETSSAASERSSAPTRWGVYGRVVWTVLSYIVVQSLIFGAAALPLAIILHWLAPLLRTESAVALVVLAVGLLPIYFVSALSLVVSTAAATLLLGWRSLPDSAMRIRDFGWPLMNWARYLMLTHAVRLLVGGPLRGTPVWGLFIHLNGARLGHRVWVNSTAVMDHSLLEIGDDTVIGSDVHLSGHMVEGGMVKTGRVNLSID